MIVFIQIAIFKKDHAPAEINILRNSFFEVESLLRKRVATKGIFMEIFKNMQGACSEKRGTFLEWLSQTSMMELFRNSHPEVFLVKGVLKISNKFTGEHPCRIVISIKLQSSFIEITLWHGCSVSLLHIFTTPSPRNTSGWLLLKHICGNSLTTLNYFFSNSFC